MHIFSPAADAGIFRVPKLAAAWRACTMYAWSKNHHGHEMGDPSVLLSLKPSHFIVGMAWEAAPTYKAVVMLVHIGLFVFGVL